MNENVSEKSAYTIPEELDGESPKQELLSYNKTEDYVSRRVLLFLRDRYSREMKLLPFQLITNYTFNLRSDFLSDYVQLKLDGDKTDPVTNLMGKRHLYMTGVILDNSMELLYNKFRFGFHLSSVLNKGTFGNLFTRFDITRDISESVELRVSADATGFMNPKLFLMSLRKKFNDTFWSSFILTLSSSFIPNLYAIFHKNINKRHSIELTVTNGLYLNYHYLKVISKYTKVNFKAIASPDNIGIELRSKTLNVFGTTLGALIRLCLMNGLSFEWFFRTFVESSYLGIMKVEYRLSLVNNKVILHLKGIINNSKVNIPVLLFKGDQNLAIYVISSLTIITLSLPLFYSTLRSLYQGTCGVVSHYTNKWQTQTPENEGIVSRISSIMTNEEGGIGLNDLDTVTKTYYKNPLRHNFYSSFPQFFSTTNYYGFSIDNGSDTSSPLVTSNQLEGNLNYELKHIKYYHYNPSIPERSGLHDGDVVQFKNDEEIVTSSEETSMVLEENSKMYNMAKSNYFKELEKKGLLVLFALYGHPRLLDYVNSHHKSIHFTFNNYTTYEDELEKLLRNSGLDLDSSLVINVTNVLMSKVNESCLYLSSSNKESLIGFTNPHLHLPVKPKLLIVYHLNTPNSYIIHHIYH
uniref:DnaJ-like protein C11 C-terminal domain-containing protein n=1 Tax=Theileria annulata TaxID=5874 RepID=A0A3B0MS30_THEAN